MVNLTRVWPRLVWALSKALAEQIMAKQIEALRNWAKTRAQFATSQPKGEARRQRKIVVGIGKN